MLEIKLIWKYTARMSQFRNFLVLKHFSYFWPKNRWYTRVVRQGEAVKWWMVPVVWDLVFFSSVQIKEFWSSCMYPYCTWQTKQSPTTGNKESEECFSLITFLFINWAFFRVETKHHIYTTISNWRLAFLAKSDNITEFIFYHVKILGSQDLAAMTVNQRKLSMKNYTDMRSQNQYPRHNSKLYAPKYMRA